MPEGTWPEISELCGDLAKLEKSRVLVHTASGRQELPLGWWVVRRGHEPLAVYPPEVFAEMYERADPVPPSDSDGGEGPDLRDYFAGTAFAMYLRRALESGLGALMEPKDVEAQRLFLLDESNHGEAGRLRLQWAQASYASADAMLIARGRKAD
jgi:hypothetical protein